MSTPQQRIFNEHVDELHKFVKAGSAFELPRGVVTRLVDSGTFKLTDRATPKKLEDVLIEATFTSTEDRIDYDAAVALYNAGVRKAT